MTTTFASRAGMQLLVVPVGVGFSALSSATFDIQTPEAMAYHALGCGAGSFAVQEAFIALGQAFGVSQEVSMVCSIVPGMVVGHHSGKFIARKFTEIDVTVVDYIKNLVGCFAYGVVFAVAAGAVIMTGKMV